MDELLIFGYGSKLFRDDEKAVYIDQGRHLIPWMGNDSLMIDRYDGRGHLYDLSKYDADNVKADPWGPTDSEKALEAACDEERYLELHVDVAEQAIYEEEEWKRYYEALGGTGYSAIGFSYDYNADGSAVMVPGEYVKEEDYFVAPAELSVPNNMVLPQTVKENAIIEKTANFIAEHGAQMEIMIKAKQKDNPQFVFMEHDHPVNPYFKHMVKMIKGGKYKPQLETKPTEAERQDSSFSADEDDDSPGYLHPSLMSSSTAAASKPVPKPVVRVHETSYGDLIKSVTKSFIKTSQSKSESPSVTPPPLAPCMAQDVYGPGPGNVPAPPGLEPVTLPPGVVSSEGVVYSGNHENQHHHRETEEIIVPQIVPPAPDVQPIIDRMALYVAKNGVDFETVVKSKKDARFDFLHSWHPHHAYYDFRKRLHLEELEQEKSEDDDNKNSIKGVSFKLKMKEMEPPPLDKRKAFDYESSDEENTDTDGVEGKEKVPTPSEDIRNPPTVQPTKTTPPLSIDLERKQAEDKVKDRLALAAREKLAQASKEKQMQAERKRKAAMFINLLKSGSSAAANTDEKGENGSGDGSKPNSRPSTPYGGVNSGKSSPVSNDFTLDAIPRAPLPKAYYGIPSSMRRQQRSPTPPSAYTGNRRSRSRSPRRFSRYPDPSSQYRSERRRSRSPKRRPSPPRSSAFRRSRSPSYNSSRNSKHRKSRSKSPKHSRHSPSHSKSKKKKHKRSRSKSRSPSRKSHTKESRLNKKDKISTVHQNGLKSAKRSSSKVEPIDDDYITVIDDDDPPPAPPPTTDLNHKMSHEKVNKVRAMLKETRKAVLKEEGIMDIDL